MTEAEKLLRQAAIAKVAEVLHQNRFRMQHGCVGDDDPWLPMWENVAHEIVDDILPILRCLPRERTF